MKKVKVGIITGFGINAHEELALAFQKQGALTEMVHVNDIRNGKANLQDYQIIGFPGGFSFGDHVGSGKILAHIIEKNAKTQIQSVLKRGGLVIGICNGFQTIIKMGLLPDTKLNQKQEASLIHNEQGHFIDQWVSLTRNKTNNSPWLKDIEKLYVPIRHGEGQLIKSQDLSDDELKKHVAFTYTDGAPNGSYLNIAGLTNTTGQVLGLMPHPECVLQEYQIPKETSGIYSNNLDIFANAVRYISKLD